MMFWIVLLLFSLTYLGLAVGKVPGLRIDRAGIALVGATAMLATSAVPFEDAFSPRCINFEAIVLLFGMMIPPFLSRGGNPTLETFVLGATFVFIAFLTDSAYAILAGKAGSWLSRSRVRAIEVVSGVLLTAGGVWMALRGR